ncbi:hypothetical protein B0H16DRAFT_1469494 [Mycena metata]|uniref:Uncharacterized protein n=1 Tax=Mycena metata TaxID=1033252 RepID=A0AAD7HXG6_9AGAR|nr:hypothetical protein B0H16DRAFT_1469494 [Mycena metata]
MCKDSPAIRHAKLMTNLFVLLNQVQAIVTAQPPFEVSANLEKNLLNYGVAVLLSSHIAAYKGAIPTNTLLDILKKHRFDLPAGIESNPADFAKVIAAVQEVLTQLRAKFKKALAASLRATKNDKKIAPGPEHQNIFKLTQIFVDGTQCKVTIELCARVALMPRCRAEAQGNAKKITKAFRYVLTQDQKDHGINDYEISDAGVDSFQQEVDDLIAAGTANLASSVTSAEE